MSKSYKGEPPLVGTETPDANQAVPPPETDQAEPEPVKMVPKRIQCPRCKGAGTFISSRTGVRAKTAFAPLTDSSRPCPKCKGRKTVVIMITEEQAIAEKAKKAQIRKEAKAAVDAKARTAKKAIDDE